MKTLYTKVLFTLFALLLAACGAQSEVTEMIREVEVIKEVAGAPVYDSDESAANAGFEPELQLDRNQLAQVTRLIIKTGNMSLDVEDIDVAVNDATQFTVGLGGYIVSQEVSGRNQWRNATMSLGVPVNDFEMAMATFREYGIVESESASGQDVTEEFVDLTSRLENLQATQTRLRQLFEAAQNVEETLEVDRELRQVEGEINLVQGRMKYLSERAAFSTITLHMSSVSDEPIGQPDEEWTLGPTIKQAFSDLTNSAQNLASSLTYFVIAVLPNVLVLALFAWVAWRIVRRVLRGVRVPRRTKIAPVSTTTASSDQ